MNIRGWVDSEGLKDYLLENGVKYYTLNNEMVFNSDESQVLALVASYDPLLTIRARLKAQLVEDSQAFVDDTLMKHYPKFEIDTFQNQLTDAKAYLADNSAITPTLDAIAARRSKSKEVIANRIIAKYNQFSAFSGNQAGRRQRLEDLIDAAETVEALNAIPKFAGV